jgi:hypothetical protein
MLGFGIFIKVNCHSIDALFKLVEYRRPLSGCYRFLYPGSVFLLLDFLIASRKINRFIGITIAQAMHDDVSICEVYFLIYDSGTLV